MSEYKVEVKNLNEIKKAFARYPEISEPILQRAIEASQATLAKHTLKHDPIPWITGNLLMSFRFDSGRLWARWYPTAKYASAVHDGRRAMTIYPVRAKALRFEVGGKVVFAKSARLPATKGNPFMPKIISKAEGDINKLFRTAADQIAEAITRRI